MGVGENQEEPKSPTSMPGPYSPKLTPLKGGKRLQVMGWVVDTGADLGVNVCGSEVWMHRVIYL